MATPGRGKSGKYRKNPETAEQDARACEMFGRGYTYREISAELGWETPSAAQKAIERAYRAVVAPTVEFARRRSIERLDHAHRAAREILDKDHVMVSHGRVIKDEATGLPLLDDGPRLQAIDRIVRIEQRLAATLGVDAPSKQSVEVISKDSLTSEMEEMMAELEAREASEKQPDDA